MAPLILSPVLLATAAGVVALLLAFKHISTSRVPKGLRPLPGPSGWPIIGNTLQLEAHPQRQLREWKKKYGEVYSLNLVGRQWAMICSPRAAKEIMDKQSAITSSRPPMPVFDKLISGGMRTLVMQYTPLWRTVRSIIHKLLTPKVSSTFKPSQMFEAKQFVYDVLTDNGDGSKFYTHSRRYTTSIVMTSTYGKRVPSWESENIQEVYKIMNELSEATMPGAFLADSYPALAELPKFMQIWRKRALGYYENQVRLWQRLWDQLQDDIRNGAAPECFVKQVSDNDLQKQDISQLQGAFTAGSLIEAGSETTASTINSALKLLAVHRRVQDTANKILTEVVGEDRTPTFDDESQLQYVRAIVKEVMRMRPVATIGAAHYSTDDVVYDGYFIPKDTIISLVISAINYDDHYGDPFEFRPERFIDHTLGSGAYAAMSDPLKRDHFGFGVGRRICPGLHLAENSLFIILARILWAFELRPALDENGEEEDLDLSDEAFEEGTIVVPKPFRLRFIPRSEAREGVIRKEWEEAQRDGYWWGNIKVGQDGMIVPETAHTSE